MFAEYLERARQGEIIHLESPEEFSPVFDLFMGQMTKDSNESDSFKDFFQNTQFDEFKSKLDNMAENLNNTKEHFGLFANIIKDEIDVNQEGFLDIDFSKSYRLFHSESLRENYGYYIHRDSWFDLDPKGVNIIFYMTDVPYYANTQFFVEHFDTDIKYEPETRKILSPVQLDQVTSFNCKERDVMIFCGDQLHAGPEIEVPRFSIEFRLSQSLDFGRKNQEILYKKVEQFL